jgi:hypothetical protein
VGLDTERLADPASYALALRDNERRFENLQVIGESSFSGLELTVTSELRGRK